MTRTISKKVKNFVKLCFPSQVMKYKAYKALIADTESYLYTTGWMKSNFHYIPCSRAGDKLPWMNYAVISFLDDRLARDLDMFEFGSGFSTLYYSRLVRHVTSVEYDSAWYDILRPQLPKNVNLIFAALDQDGGYCRTISSENKKFDIIVVDGRDRVNCVKQAINSLTKRGVVILDDSDRKEYREGIEILMRNDFRSITFEGLKPTGTNIESTTIFYRPNNCLDI